MNVVFFDRDGTINEDPNGYISSPENFKLYPFTAQAISIFNKLGYKTIIVSNQSGIERGYFTENDLYKIHKYMIDELAKENAYIDMILYSPYIDHYTRKPKSGMFIEALKKYKFKANHSYMIGDKNSDIEFGKKHGLTTFLVKTGEGLNTMKNLNVNPDFIVDNILSAANTVAAISDRHNRTDYVSP